MGWRDTQMLTVPHRNTGMPFLAMLLSSMEELSCGAHANKNSSHYPQLKPNTSPQPMLPRKPSDFGTSLVKSSAPSQNP